MVGLPIGLSGSGLGAHIGSWKCSIDKIPWQWCWLHKRGLRAFLNGRLLGWYFGGEGSRGGSQMIGSSDPGCGVGTHGGFGNITNGGAGGSMGDRGAGAFTDGTVVIGWLGKDEGNGPNDKYADGVCLQPHFAFLLVSLAAFRSSLSVATKS